MVAAVVLPYFWMLWMTFASGIPSTFWQCSLMRRLAWCIRTSDTSSMVTRLRSRTCWATSTMRVVASLNT